jgi:hypothetical protein
MDGRTSSLQVFAGVTAYQHGSYGGAKQTFTQGNHDVGALGIVGNDAISSVQVAPGMKVTLYSESGFWGNQVVLTGHVSNVGALLNDNTSSLIVSPL